MRDHRDCRRWCQIITLGLFGLNLVLLVSAYVSRVAPTAPKDVSSLPKLEGTTWVGTLTADARKEDVKIVFGVDTAVINTRLETVERGIHGFIP